MSQHTFFAFLSVFLYLVGFIPYIYHIFRGKVVPHPFSWTTWCVFAGVNAYILILTSGMSTALIPMFVRMSCLVLGSIAGWYLIRRISISMLDYFFLLLTVFVITMVQYYGLRNAVIAMICIDFLILTPTLKKIYQNPESEDALVWFTASLSLACLILSLPSITFENSLFWFYTVCVNLAVALFIRIWTIRRSHTWRGRVVTFLGFFHTHSTRTFRTLLFAIKKKSWYP